MLEGWQIPGVSPDKDFRYNIEKKANERSIDELYQELVSADPDAAAKIDRRNVRRVIRALEVHAKAGKAFSELGRKTTPCLYSTYYRLDRRQAVPLPHGRPQS